MTQDLATLQNIADTLKVDPMASQRTLAKNSGMSVSLMNSVLKRFAERGWIMLSNVNGRKLAYALTPDGLSELAERGKNFAIRTFYLANTYSQSIVNAISKPRDEGKTKVVLYGKSYIKFLLEYACSELGVGFEVVDVGDEVGECLGSDISAQKGTSFCLVEELNDKEVQERLVKAGGGREPGGVSEK